MASVLTFMNGALVTWVGTFRSDKLTYDDLAEGMYLNTVMEHIDPGVKVKEIDYYSLNCSSRITNFERLLRNIINFYQTQSHQLIVMKLPDIVKVAKEPESDSALDELNKLLLLLLGCAVQSNRKAQFVEKIKSLDVNTQEQLVDAIKLVTESACSLFPDDVCYDQMNERAVAMYKNIKQLVVERNTYYSIVCDIQQDLDYYRGLADKRESAILSTPPPPVNNGRSIELQQMTNELQQLRLNFREQAEELEEKSRQVVELTHDLEERDTTLARLKLENCRLIEEKTAWQQDQNELEILLEKAEDKDKLENEVFLLKQKVAELDFYKNRVEELRVDNGLLLDRRTELEARLDKASKRSESLIDEIVQYQMQADESKAERDQLKGRIQFMVEEQALLEKERNKLITQLRLERERSECVAVHAMEGPSLSEELMNTTFTQQMFEQQMENERLRDQIDRIHDEMEQEARWRSVELQRKIAYLQAEAAKLKEKAKTDDVKYKELEMKLMEANRNYERLEDELSMVKDRHEAEVETYRGQMDDLRHQIVLLRQRNCQENDVRCMEIEAENVAMFNSVQNLSTQVTRLKYHNRVLRKSCDKLKEDADRSAPYGDENYRLRTENDDLRRAAANAKVAVDVTSDLESRNIRLEIEIRKLKKLVDILKTTLSRVDPMNRISYHYITSL